MARRLTKLGHQVENLSYPSTKTDKRRFFNTLDEKVKDGPVIMVGHSLGGLVFKDYLKSRKLSVEQVPMVITLGTPHQGAQITKDMAKFNLHHILGSSLQFGLLPKSFEKTWTLPQKLISIAGDLKIGAKPLLDKVWRENIEESDGTVAISETKIPGMTEHIIVRQNHTGLVYSKEVVDIIDKFAKTL